MALISMEVKFTAGQNKVTVGFSWGVDIRNVHVLCICLSSQKTGLYLKSLATQLVMENAMC